MSSRNAVLPLRLGSQIAHVRHERGLTQAELAEDVGIDARSIQRIEAGRTAPSLQRLCAIAESLGVRPGALLDAATGARKGNPPLATAARDEGPGGRVDGSLLRAWERVPPRRRALAIKVLRLLATDAD
jgi:transcriptional regulator with XRE-family HTH domain